MATLVATGTAQGEWQALWHGESGWAERRYMMFKKSIVCLFLAVTLVFSIGVFLDTAHAWNVAVSRVDYPYQGLDPKGGI